MGGTVRGLFPFWIEHYYYYYVREGMYPTSQNSVFKFTSMSGFSFRSRLVPLGCA